MPRSSNTVRGRTVRHTAVLFFLQLTEAPAITATVCLYHFSDTMPDQAGSNTDIPHENISVLLEQNFKK